MVAVQWDDRLIEASVRRAKNWAADNPLKYSIAFGVPAVIFQGLITAGVFRVGGLVEAILSVVLVPIAIVVVMLGRTWLLMLYEVREALGEHVTPARARRRSGELQLRADRGGPTTRSPSRSPTMR